MADQTVPQLLPKAIATRYAFAASELFSGDPLDSADRYDPFAVTIDWRGGDTWAICRGSGWNPQLVWNEAGGCWEYEPLPSERSDDFLRRCRYPLEEALAIGARLVASNAAKAPIRPGVCRIR